jgi:hypothetical protein
MCIVEAKCRVDVGREDDDHAYNAATPLLLREPALPNMRAKAASTCSWRLWGNSLSCNASSLVQASELILSSLRVGGP